MLKPWKSVQDSSWESAYHYSSTASHLSSLRSYSSLVARQLLDSSLTDRHLSWFMKNRFSVLFWLQSVIMCLGFLVSQPRHIKWLFYGLSKCSWIAQVLSKVCSSKLWPEIDFALVHRSCEEVAAFVHRRVLWPSIFLIFIMDELKNFAAKNLL